MCCFLLLLLSVNVRYCPIWRVFCLFVCVCLLLWVCVLFIESCVLLFVCLFWCLCLFLFSYFLSGTSIIYNMYVTVHALDLKQ